jgi:putative tryptophan/tyrosine transport system substrate-binding protein
MARGRPMPLDRLKRREFVTLIGGVAAWPFVVNAQEADRKRRIGVLLNFRMDDAEGHARVTAFQQALQELGWIAGDNLRTDIRWAGDDAELYRRYAQELVALAPDVILAGSSPSVAALQRATSSVPIVFAFVVDPVGAGFITSLAHPGGNITGFTAFEYSISGKWLELLKKIVPNLIRVAVLRDPAVAAGIGQFAAIESTVSSSAIELSSIDTRDANEMVRALNKFAGEPNGGVIETASVSGTTHRETIISTVMRQRLPAVYPFRYYVVAGGLASYGPDPIDQFKRAAKYVDRILKGAKPSELPVQTPTKYELVINLKTAKALGLEIPSPLLTTADEVIE